MTIESEIRKLRETIELKDKEIAYLKKISRNTGNQRLRETETLSKTNAMLKHEMETVLKQGQELKKLEKQILQAKKMEAIGTLVGGIAHNFNNMLAGIMGNAYLANEQLPETSPLKENLESIDKLSLRAADIIKQLLTFTRKGQTSMQPIQMSAFLDETLNFAKCSVPENIKIILEGSQDDF